MKTADIWKGYLNRTLRASEAEQALKEKPSRTADLRIAMIQLDRNASSMLGAVEAPDGAASRIAKMVEVADLPALAPSKDPMWFPLRDFVSKHLAATQPEVVGAGAPDSNQVKQKPTKVSSKRIAD